MDKDEFDILKEHFICVLDEAIGKYDSEKGMMEYDHLALSTYQSALHYAVYEMGWIEEHQLSRPI